MDQVLRSLRLHVWSNCEFFPVGGQWRGMVGNGDWGWWWRGRHMLWEKRGDT